MALLSKRFQDTGNSRSQVFVRDVKRREKSAKVLHQTSCLEKEYWTTPTTPKSIRVNHILAMYVLARNPNNNLDILLLLVLILILV